MVSSLLFALPAFSVAEDVSSDWVEIEFKENFVTCHSRAVLWEQLQISTINSEYSWLWPNRHSVMKGEGLFNGAWAQVQYKLLWGGFEYGYRIVNVIPGTQFEYVSDDAHAFRGGAMVSLGKGPSGETTLSWSGRYLIPKSNLAGRAYFHFFSRIFFRDLRKSLEDSCG